jgi:hypothetical protein
MGQLPTFPAVPLNDPDRAAARPADLEVRVDHHGEPATVGRPRDVRRAAATADPAGPHVDDLSPLRTFAARDDGEPAAVRRPGPGSGRDAVERVVLHRDSARASQDASSV